MATISGTWTENQIVTLNESNLSKGFRGYASIDLAASGYVKVNSQIMITWNAGGNGNASIDIKGSPSSGAGIDTISLFEQDMAYSASTTKRMSFEIDRWPYVEIGITNGNTNATDINISMVYAGLKYTST